MSELLKHRDNVPFPSEIKDARDGILAWRRIQRNSHLRLVRAYDCRDSDPAGDYFGIGESEA